VLVYGADQPTDTIRNAADELIREAVTDRTGIEMPGWKPYDEGAEQFDRVTRAAGASVEGLPAISWPGRTSAGRMIERLSRKDFSSSWLIPDEALAGVVEAVRPRLAALFGGLDVEQEYERSFSLRVARLP
jgi:hypothetical protein